MVGADKLTIGLVGLGSVGRRALAALRQCRSVEVVGAADRDQAVLAEAQGAAGVPIFSDSRSLLAETRPQAVYIALPPAPAAELVATCAQRGIHVIKEPPLARSLAEGASLVRQMDQAKLKFVMATQRRFTTSYRRAFATRHAVGRPFLARAHYLFNWGPVVGWRADAVSAGGGALMELGGPLVDLLVWLLGLPESVFGLNAINARPDQIDRNGRPMPPTTTDDTTAAVLRFADGAMGSLAASRVSGPMSEQIAVHGQQGSILADPQHCVLRDPDGGVMDQFDALTDPSACRCDMVEAFAQAVLTKARRYACSAHESLLTLAVLDALYLSEKTASAESPLTMLQSGDFTVEQCLAHRPAEVVDD